MFDLTSGQSHCGARHNVSCSRSTRVSTYLGALLGDDGHGGPANISSSHTTDLEFPVTHLGLLFGLSKGSKCGSSLRRWTANLYAMKDDGHAYRATDG